ncbi:MAG: glycosyltransferase family 4 protein [Acidobacteria bacterium]|nr:glycosyltransferase family 4 protein [Acidobacteriota bacterium]
MGQTLAEALEPQLVQVSLVFAYDGPGIVGRNPQLATHYLGSRGFADFPAWLRARRLFSRLQIDVIHFMDPVIWIYSAMAYSRHRRVLHQHGRPGPSLPRHAARMTLVQKTAARILGRSADGQICISHGSQRAIENLKWGKPGKLWTVHNALDCRRFAHLPSRVKARARFHIPAGSKVLGMVCRLVRYRGCEEAIRVLSQLSSDWHLLFCGDGPLRPELEAMTQDKQLRDRVHFSGLMENVLWAYSAMDLFLFLARYEGGGLALAEAMAAKVPVIGLEGDGEYREPEYPLVTPDNATLIARSQPLNYDSVESPQVLSRMAGEIEKWSAHPECFEAKTRNAARWVEERFNSSLQARRMTEVYQAVLEQSSR